MNYTNVNLQNIEKDENYFSTKIYSNYIEKKQYSTNIRKNIGKKNIKVIPQDKTEKKFIYHNYDSDDNSDEEIY